MAMVMDFPLLHPAFMARKPYKKARDKHPGHWIREWREAKDLSQERLAERVGLSVPQVSKIENGKQGYRQDTLEQFAAAMGLEPADLLRPPHAPKDELAAYVMGLSEKRRKRALRVLQALAAEEGDGEETDAKSKAKVA